MKIRKWSFSSKTCFMLCVHPFHYSFWFASSWTDSIKNWIGAEALYCGANIAVKKKSLWWVLFLTLLYVFWESTLVARLEWEMPLLTDNHLILLAPILHFDNIFSWLMCIIISFWAPLYLYIPECLRSPQVPVSFMHTLCIYFFITLFNMLWLHL